MFSRSLPLRRLCQHVFVRPLTRNSTTRAVPRSINGLLRPNSEINGRPQEPSNSPISQLEPLPKAKNIPPSYLAYHWDTTPANSEQLSRAASFFTKHSPKSVFFASKLHTIPCTNIPEVAFIGRSNVGKSSLLNALLGMYICNISSKPGRTRSMNAFAIGGPDGLGNSGRITVLDMPGYGKGSRHEWGKEITKYLVGRKELKRVFFLIDPLHGIKKTDEMMLTMLRHKGVPHQIVLNKVDRILLPDHGKGAMTQQNLENRREKLRTIVEQLKPVIQPKNDGPPALGEVLACSTDLGRYRQMSTEVSGQLGINAVRWAVLEATGMSGTNDKLYSTTVPTASPANFGSKTPDISTNGAVALEENDEDDEYDEEDDILDEEEDIWDEKDTTNNEEAVHSNKDELPKMVRWRPM